MHYTNELYLWLLDFLFVIGVLLIPLGAGFMLLPEKMFTFAAKANRWISTESFFEKINRPVYKEKFFYRHHKIFGLFILIASSICFYMLTFYIGLEEINNSIVKLVSSNLQKWIIIILYYQLLVGLIITMIFGLVMVVRPSALKSFEKWANRWIDTDGSLKVLDKSKDLPDRILPGNPRIFGFCILLAGVYILWNTYPF